MKKKEREIEKEFDWYHRKDGNWYIRHNLARSGNNPEYRKIQAYLDSGCRNFFGLSGIEYLLQLYRFIGKKLST